MKKLLLTIALCGSLASLSLAGARDIASAASVSARQITAAVSLNEVQYLKVKTIETTRLSEIEKLQGTLTGSELEASVAAINAKYTTEILTLLSVDQKIKFLALKKEQVAQAN